MFHATCPIHPTTRMICPRCAGAKGAKQTISKHRRNLAEWGRKGGKKRAQKKKQVQAVPKIARRARRPG